jgi:hypothetical protein
MSQPGSFEVETVAMAELRAAVEEALASEAQAGAAIELHLKNCLKAGQMLRKHRGEQDHGEWLAWLGENLPTITRQTARKWIKLAEFEEKQSLESCSTITQAYRLAGLLPDAENKGKGSGGGGNGSVDVLELSHRLENTLTQQITARPLQGWPRQDLMRLKERLRPLSETYEAVERLLDAGPAPL